MARRDEAKEEEAGRTVNLYLIYSPLHYLAAQSVAANLEKGSANYLFYLKAEFREMIDPAGWDGVSFLPWPRFYPEKGLLGRTRRTLKNLELVADICQGASAIRLHTPVIDTEAVNYCINYLRSRYPKASFSARLIPDGLLNVQRHPLGFLKELMQYLRKARRLVTPALDYYPFRGDRTGSDDPIVDRIYVLPRFPHEYDRNKTFEISLLKPTESAAPPAVIRRALVLGQPLTAFKRFSVADMQAVSLGIRALIAETGIADIEYKSHPRDPDREFGHPDYRELVIVEALETYLATHPYQLVIGVCSTALLTARLILPEECRVVAYGMDMMQYRGEEDKKKIESPFRMLGVEMIDHRGRE